MGVFHVFQIVQMVTNRATHNKLRKIKWLIKCSFLIKLIENLLILKGHITSKDVLSLQQNLNNFIVLYNLDLTELKSQKGGGGYYLEKVELYTLIYFLVKVFTGAIRRDIFEGTQLLLNN